jgi:hypothetical protein
MWADMLLTYLLGLGLTWLAALAAATLVGARARAQRDWDEAFERELAGSRL